MLFNNFIKIKILTFVHIAIVLFLKRKKLTFTQSDTLTAQIIISLLIVFK